MSTRSRAQLAAAVGAGVFLIAATPEAAAWGSATHVYLGQQMVALAPLMPAAIAALITRFSLDFLFGNTAADVILAKKFCDAKLHCHNWSVGFTLLDEATRRVDDGQAQAFAWGYLSHLAADTVAHNKFVPAQITLAGSSRALGHLHWEMRADATLPDQTYHQVRRLLRHDFHNHNELLSHHLAETILPFPQALDFFKRSNLLNASDTWQTAIRAWERASRHPINRDLLHAYRDESAARMVDVLTHGTQSWVVAHDPVGTAALEHIRLQQRWLKRIARHTGRRHMTRHEFAAQFAPDRRIVQDYRARREAGVGQMGAQLERSWSVMNDRAVDR